ncbi:MAG: FAD-dependent thymidylate synthase [Aquificota bacterium]|nr:FAD-dependent thymidylate synthase [Aquificota bacterium]
MGSDQRSVRCARVSFGKDDKVDPERDKKLLRFLFRHRHASPFEHNIIAFEIDREGWLRILSRLNNPTVQIYYSGGYAWINLRNVVNSMEHLPEEVLSQIERSFPATWAIVRSGGEIEDDELSQLPYTTDRVFLEMKAETESGWVGLVDSLELGTDMDYYTFIVECPLFVARQWMRHRFGSYNEISRRYTSYDIKFYIPNYLRKQASKNKQASVDEPVEDPYQTEFLEEIKESVERSLSLYSRMIEREVAKELARGVLPQFMKTRFYWTVPRIALDNFLTLRTHEGAQKEIRELAEAIRDMVGYRGTDRKNRL